MPSFDFPTRTRGEAKHEATMTVRQCGSFAKGWLRNDNVLADCTWANGHDAPADEWGRAGERDRGCVTETERESLEDEVDFSLELGIYWIRIFLIFYIIFLIIIL